MITWSGSIRIFRNRRAVVTAGMLLALHLVLAVFVSLPLTDTVKISISFITNVVTAYLFGPWMAFVTGALGDILQFVIKPTGGYFFGWTLNAAISGFLYGMAFYRKAPQNVEKQKNISPKADLLPAGLLLLTLICWAALPFLSVITKATEDQPEPRVLAEGSALWHMLGKAGETGNEGGIAAAVLVFVAAGILFSLFHRKVLAMLSSVLACLWLLLPVYTDRKVMKAEAGFYLIAAGLVVAILVQLLLVLRQHELDGLFLFRCFVTMAIVAVAVQMFLGTVWCCVMYGKGFWFYFTPRAVKSLIQLPFNTVLVYYCMRAVKQLRFKQIAGLED